jgi:Predicted NADH:ubiquinone oxidoreductase, subunit RnfB
MNVVLITIITLAALGGVSAIILYFVAQKFKVFEDPKIDEVEQSLPAANCGGCGFPGCRGFAEALVKADDISSMNCPVGGAPVMATVAKILGKNAVVATPKIAVLRCNGSCEHRPKLTQYDGATTCAIAASHYGSETGCTYGCYGLGDCVFSLRFRCHVHGRKNRFAGNRRRKMRGMRRMCQSLPQDAHRAAPQRPQRTPHICIVHEQRQRSHSQKIMRSGMHRLQQVREGVCL